MQMYVMPISILLKDNADDIKEKIDTYHTHPILEKIKEECHGVTELFAAANVKFAPERISFEDLAKLVDVVFIALHGRPGEDGTLQQELLKFNIAFNGSGIASSQTTINKYETLQLLKSKGFIVTKQKLVYKDDYLKDAAAVLSNIELELPFPIIAKPVDDGCSSAVKKIKTAEEMKAYLELLYREQTDLQEGPANILHLKPKEEFPQKNVVLLEELISKGDATQFMEITGGMLTHYTAEGKVMYEVFEPSEALADGEVLSLEEKFLAGQGQNITPARFANDEKRYKLIAKQVKKTLEDAAVALNVEGYCRIDAFVRIYEDGRAETIIIEVNSLPGMTPATCIYHQAAINDYQPFQFIDKILEFGIKRQNGY
jgi:D-alanine-D-alanine ligase